MKPSPDKQKLPKQGQYDASQKTADDDVQHAGQQAVFEIICLQSKISIWTMTLGHFKHKVFLECHQNLKITVITMMP